MKCSSCGITEEELAEKNNLSKNIIQHHLDYYNDITIPLCLSCHKKWHNNNQPIGNRKEMQLLKKIKTGKIKGQEWKKNSEWFYGLVNGNKLNSQGRKKRHISPLAIF